MQNYQFYSSHPIVDPKTDAFISDNSVFLNPLPSPPPQRAPPTVQFATVPPRKLGETRETNGEYILHEGFRYVGRDVSCSSERVVKTHLSRPTTASEYEDNRIFSNTVGNMHTMRHRPRSSPSRSQGTHVSNQYNAVDPYTMSQHTNTSDMRYSRTSTPEPHYHQTLSILPASETRNPASMSFGDTRARSAYSASYLSPHYTKMPIASQHYIVSPLPAEQEPARSTINSSHSRSSRVPLRSHSRPNSSNIDHNTTKRLHTDRHVQVPSQESGLYGGTVSRTALTSKHPDNRESVDRNVASATRKIIETDSSASGRLGEEIRPLSSLSGFRSGRVLALSRSIKGRQIDQDQ